MKYKLMAVVLAATSMFVATFTATARPAQAAAEHVADIGFDIDGLGSIEGQIVELHG